MREEFRRKMREDIDLLGQLVDALDGLHEQTEAEFDGIEWRRKAWSLSP